MNLTRIKNPEIVSPAKQFVWSRGCLEVPVSCISSFCGINRLFDFNFNNRYLSELKYLLEFLDRFYAERGVDAIAVLVLHSWSFLDLSQDGSYYCRIQPNKAHVFNEFLTAIKKHVTVVTSTDVIKDNLAGNLDLDPVREFRSELSVKEKVRAIVGSNDIIANNKRSESVVLTQYSIKSDVEGNIQSSPAIVKQYKSKVDSCCPICLTKKSEIVLEKGTICAVCGSHARLRSFAISCQHLYLHKINISNARVLLIGPTASEITYLASQNPLELCVLDVRRTVISSQRYKAIYEDICNIPSTYYGAYDYVIASYLMPFVHDMDGALASISNLLVANGIFILI